MRKKIRNHWINKKIEIIVYIIWFLGIVISFVYQWTVFHSAETSHFEEKLLFTTNEF